MVYELTNHAMFINYSSLAALLQHSAAGYVDAPPVCPVITCPFLDWKPAMENRLLKKDRVRKAINRITTPWRLCILLSNISTQGQKKIIHSAVVLLQHFYSRSQSQKYMQVSFSLNIKRESSCVRCHWLKRRGSFKRGAMEEKSGNYSQRTCIDYLHQ